MDFWSLSQEFGVCCMHKQQRRCADPDLQAMQRFVLFYHIIVTDKHYYLLLLQRERQPVAPCQIEHWDPQTPH